MILTYSISNQEMRIWCDEKYPLTYLKSKVVNYTEDDEKCIYYNN